MKHKLQILGIIGCCMGVWLHQAAAATAFSNLGQTRVGSLPVASDSWRGEAFYTGTNAAGYVLKSVQLQLTAATGGPSGFKLSLYDANGVVPGNSLELLSGVEPSGSGVFTFQSSGLVLNPSRKYFVVATASTPLAAGAFQWDLTSWIDQANIFEFHAGGILYSSPNGQAWYYTRPNNFMFAVNATIVPEPGTLALGLCGGVLGLAAREAGKRGRG